MRDGVMVHEDAEAAGFLFVGNLLWLDFVNTEQMRDGIRVDLLSAWGDFLAWRESAAGAPSLPDAARRGREQEAMGRVRALRRTLRGLAEALSQGQAAPPESVAAINDVLAARTGHLRLTPDTSAESPNGWRREFVGPEDEPVHLLAPVAESAAETLARGDLSLVRKCENPRCILYFYDTTRNHKRRWCRMAACGNRAKAAAHYQRHRAPARSGE